ncbi:MAG: hypothetical protein JWM96_123 [Alphaproteobacteria bacterium]|nr:hypothetical protein [Alphaproteobacteria bacterium]
MSCRFILPLVFAVLLSACSTMPSIPDRYAFWRGNDAKSPTSVEANLADVPPVPELEKARKDIEAARAEMEKAQKDVQFNYDPKQDATAKIYNNEFVHINSAPSLASKPVGAPTDAAMNDGLDKQDPNALFEGNID